ncbi:MAG: nicotinate (nicotinamide) nucleotide adenylyltransferase [Anaerolineales bacterium]|nr:nicotinate (nicotinamide) nucleotide adenylyltransferase [Anaerolineales bacterium]
MAGLIGVFGGTFDPPHLGHAILADCGRGALGLDRVLWVLTPEPPHKPDWPITPVEHRLAMVMVVIENDMGFELSRVDLDRPAPHYSHGTMEILRTQYPQAQLVYLMGSDSLKDLNKWNQPERFVRLCDALGVMQRTGASSDVDQLESEIPGIKKKLRFFEAPFIDISGRDIRQRVREGAPYRYLVTDAVAKIIKERELYRVPPM